MKLSTFAPLALSVAPSLVSAATGSLGFALGTKNADGSCKAQKDYEADFDAISANTPAKVVRGYSASDCNSAQYILPAAKSKNFQVVLGIWPDVDTSYNADLSAITKNAPNYADQVWGITVGSETLYRGNFTGAQLAAKMSAVKTATGGKFKIGTADSWNKYADGTADAVIKSGPDFLFINAFGFWQGAAIANASHTYFDDISQSFNHIESIAGTGKIELWTGETGWPTTDQTKYEAAVGGVSNAQTFYTSGICSMLNYGYNAFYFEAFDEPWKPASIGLNGQPADETHWGAMNADRTTKFPLKC
ncbi:putative glucan 1,3-beta-glucosidase [Microthyrium microscopicum]|uniref:glucan 1,3-beta-glucosidase n=1 Tax=Microthyrium microscopicum TaxID=703497 RepID=A0A6A6U9T1_9PEZI|nr:putative glucan 1,3-beta-glucosidase [Microthyrium microscopicum]